MNQFLHKEPIKKAEPKPADDEEYFGDFPDDPDHPIRIERFVSEDASGISVLKPAKPVKE